jgi:hypothetical protein
MLKMLGIGVGVLSLVALVACAEGPKVEGDVNTTVGEQNAAEPPQEKASLPAPTNPTPSNTAQPQEPVKDAGSSTPPPSTNDAGSSSGAPTSGEDCPLDPVYIAKLAFTSNPPACPCAAGMCCVGGGGCVAK